MGKTKEMGTQEMTLSNITQMIYTIRGKQVMLDSDLAMLYQVETKRINEAVRRNQNRFPEDFCFRLTKDEYLNLKSQIVISREFNKKEDGRGGRRTAPYVFTEQGVAMLSAVLKSDIAIQVSIHIMNAFVEMRHFISNNAVLFERISHIELKQLIYQKETDEKMNQIFEMISTHKESHQKIFYEGQIYDAYSLLVSLIQQAEKEIILIDSYVDEKTLNLLSKKKDGVVVCIYTKRNTKLKEEDINVFNSQYPKLDLFYSESYHDRFLIIDKSIVYHIGASIKDAGKKCFGIHQIIDSVLVDELLAHLISESK